MSSEPKLPPPEVAEAFREAGEAVGRALWLIVDRLAAPAPVPAPAETGPWTNKAFAARHGKSVSWVNRAVASGMPFEWSGTSKRFAAAADEWLKAQGRFAAKASPKAPTEDPIDVSSAMRRAGLRAVGGVR